MRKHQGNENCDKNIYTRRMAIDNQPYKRERHQRKYITYQEPPFPVVRRSETNKVRKEFPKCKIIVSRIDERIRAICFLISKEKKANRNKYKKNLPIRKIKSLESPYDIVRFTKGTFVNAITTEEEKHRDTNFSKNSKITDSRNVENIEQTREYTTRNSARKKPKVMQEHTNNRNPLHDFGVVWRQKIINFFRDILHIMSFW